jgi:hypothetical protein
MERRTAATGILLCSALVVSLTVAGFLWPVLTCPHCKGAGQFVITISSTDTMGGITPGRTGSKCALCIGRKRATLANAIKYWVTGREPLLEPPYERYQLD